MSSTPQASDPRQQLITLLRQAAQVEHTLACSYLYAGCSLKSTPQEFRDLPDGTPNVRRAIQFERARNWKTKIQTIAVEEMLHLHYVQCLLRALGEPPYFDLPPRGADGKWVFKDWLDLTLEQQGQPAPVVVGLDPLTSATIRRFVAYESNDMVQDLGGFTGQMLPMLSKMNDLETAFHVESMLLDVPEGEFLDALRAKLHALYAPAVNDAKPVETMPISNLAPATTHESSAFQSIANLYLLGILPLYKQAFDEGWVTHCNRRLDDELLDPNYAGSTGGRLVPIGPVTSPNRFGNMLTKSVTDPLRHFKDVESIIHMIVDEGEGAGKDIVTQDVAQVDLVGHPERVRAYLKALLAAGNTPLLGDMQKSEILRQSHLYRFAMVMAELDQEKLWARKSNAEFDAAREPLRLADYPDLTRITTEVVEQFNAAYLVVVAWMSRVYEIRNWIQDIAQRKAIEMMGSWTLMSLAVRPLLELISFLPVSTKDLYSIERASLPSTPADAHALHELYNGTERSQAINLKMDHHAVRVLSGIAAWADGSQAVIEGSSIPAHAKQMILTRLRALAHLDEFERQFAYRTHGGYSDRMPDLLYQQQHPGGSDYEEAPDTVSPLFENTLVLRLRFSGWGLVQLATDPDPPSDEAGCTGTHMFHAADGDRRFDRAVLWQSFNPARTILREPREKLPPIGVNCVDLSLMVANGGATAAYVPLQCPNPAAPLQTMPVAQQLQIHGLDHVITLKPGDVFEDGRQIHVNLEDKNGIPPFLNGFNHLVWQDGEPLDPFVFSVSAEAPASGDSPGRELLLQREIYNNGLTLMQMTPLQRLLSARGPVGTTFNLTLIPDWATTPQQRETILGSGYPAGYLQQRATDLAQALSQRLDEPHDSQQACDEVISLAERLSDISFPLQTTVIWLRVLQMKGHTLSGPLTLGSGENPILSALSRQMNLDLSIPAASDRSKANSRWAVSYHMGTMDTDALSAFVFGELYIPLQVAIGGKPIEITRLFSFPAGMSVILASYACNFNEPFWAPYDVNGDQRTIQLPNGTAITETLSGSPAATSYSYTLSGISGAESFVCAIAVAQHAERCELSWQSTFACVTAEAIVEAVGLVASTTEQMRIALAKYFTPAN